MPAFKTSTILEVARNVRAFLNLEAGVTRSGVTSVPGQDQEPGKQAEPAARRELEKARHLLESRDRELAQLRARLNGKGVEAGTGGLDPKNVVWLFGSGRSGSTWLSSMMGDMSGQTLWGEPWVGMLFGEFYYLKGEKRQGTPQFILGRHRESWSRSIRNFVLDAAATTFPDLGGGDYLVIKEPNGSTGAPLLMEALPESRMVLLIRDPRDVVASMLDARREGGWNYENNKNVAIRQRNPPPPKDSVVAAENLAGVYLRGMENARSAYEAHRGHKALIRYEELRLDTLGTMRRMYEELRIPVNEEELGSVVDKHSWENIPEENRGEGKFYRKATPGGWNEDLSPEQAEVVERITAPLLEAFYR